MGATLTLKQRFSLILATGFGLGLSPVMSGTTGSIPGLFIAWWMLSHLNVYWQMGVAAALAFLAMPICGAAEKIYKTKDDGRIVADEYLTFPLCIIGLPCLVHPSLWVIAFVTNRALDIIKPTPARQIQKVRGGPGIVLDDMVSSLYALALNHAIYHALNRWVFKA